MGSLFGTDGIRGVANSDLTAELALDVGRAVAVACRLGILGPVPAGRPVVVVGRDTRPSGPMLVDALCAGVRSAGADVMDVGILPTPGVALLTSAGAQAGVVVSASHNPAPDNGIKLFGPDGSKLSEPVERAVEEMVGKPYDVPTGAGIGRDAVQRDDAAHAYVDWVTGRCGPDLSGLRVVVDCANGAAHRVAPQALRALGAEVIALNAPDDPGLAGERINDGCGATHPEIVAEAARAHDAIGLTLDGDADRVLAADEEGHVVDGDAIVAILARRLRDRGALTGGGIAVTVMSNQALRRWCAHEGIHVVETPVGDRHLLAAMRERGLVCGAEQSGHVLLLDLAPTGDGLLTGLALLEAVVSGGGRLSDVVPFHPFPQVLVNVRGASREGVAESAQVRGAVSEAESKLGDGGRVLIRPSGTEPLVRVMVEAPDRAQAEALAADLAAVVEREMRE